MDLWQQGRENVFVAKKGDWNLGWVIYHTFPYLYGLISLGKLIWVERGNDRR